MRFVGRYYIPSQPAEVWRCMMDTDVLHDTIPACQSVEQLAADHYEIKVAVSIALLKLRFSGDLYISEANPPESYRLTAQANGGRFGAVEGHASVTLQPHDNGTMLIYEAEAGLTGRLASLAEGALKGAASRLSDKFFDRFAAAMRSNNAQMSDDAAQRPARPPKPQPVGAG